MCVCVCVFTNIFHVFWGSKLRKGCEALFFNLLFFTTALLLMSKYKKNTSTFASMLYGKCIGLLI